MAGYAVGSAALATLACLLAVTAWRVRRAALPEWSGAPARLAEAIVGVAVLTVDAQLLGAIGLFRRWPLVGAVALEAVAVSLMVRPRSRAAEEAPVRSSRGQTAVALALSAVVTAQWTAHAINAVNQGILDADTRQYHLPFAAFFARTGWTTHLHIAWLDPTWSFYPANSELVHATGILLYQRDILSPLVNIGWLLLALLAGWCVGRPWGMGPACLAGTALAVTPPVISALQGGTAGNDIPLVALLLSACALVLTAGPDTRLAVAGAAAGLAVGTKVTAYLPVAALTVAVLIVNRPRRRAAALWTAPLLATASFWYLRNLARVGNPFPPLDIGLPRPRLRALDAYGYRVVDYLGDGRFWRTTVPKGLSEAFGAWWPLLLAVAAAGAVLAVGQGRTVLVRLLGLVAVVTAIGYAFTPASAWGPKGDPFYFFVNVRYAVPAIAIGLVLLPLARPVRRRVPLVLAAYVVLVLITQFRVGPTMRSWPAARGVDGLALAAVLTFAIAIWLLSRQERTMRILLTGTAAMVLAVGGYAVQHRYLDRRYRGSTSIDAWARGVHHARIGTVGYPDQYPLAGLDLSNEVDYVGAPAPHNGIHTAATCPRWRDLLNRGRYDYVVTGKDKWLLEPHEEDNWTRSDPHAVEVLRVPQGSVFALRGQLNPAACIA